MAREGRLAPGMAEMHPIHDIIRQPSVPSKEKKPLLSPGDKGKLFFERFTSLKRKDLKHQKEELRSKAEVLREDSESSVLGGAGINRYLPEDYQLRDGEEREFIVPESLKEVHVIDLVEGLKEWINDELREEYRMLITSLDTDLHNGVVLRALIKKLSGLDIPMVTGEYVQSEERIKLNLEHILVNIDGILGIKKEERKWSAETLLDQNFLHTLRLLMALVEHYKNKGLVHLQLPKDVPVEVFTVKKVGSQLKTTQRTEHLIKPKAKDGFDTLFEKKDKEKLEKVKQPLLRFANKELGNLNRRVDNLEEDFRDGVNLLLMVGNLGGYFLNLSSYYPSPKNIEEILHNLNFAFELIEELGVSYDRNYSRELSVGDQTATLRVLYYLFTQFSHHEEEKETVL